MAHFLASPTEQPLVNPVGRRAHQVGARAVSRHGAKGARPEAAACLAVAATVSTEKLRAALIARARFLLRLANEPNEGDRRRVVAATPVHRTSNKRRT